MYEAYDPLPIHNRSLFHLEDQILALYDVDSLQRACSDKTGRQPEIDSLLPVVRVCVREV